MNWKEKQFGRLIGKDELIIEDLGEDILFNIANNMSSKGYFCEYWKAEKQESGHLHIKNISNIKYMDWNKANLYKMKMLEKYVPKEYLSKVDINFYNRKEGSEPHRIVTENTSHYKGYGIKRLIKTFGEEKECNQIEEDIIEKVLNSSDETLSNSNNSVLTSSVIKNEVEEITKLWKQGQRQNLTLAFAGYLRKNKGLGINSVKDIIKNICANSKDKELSMRLKAVDTTFQKDLKDVVGISMLEKFGLVFEEEDQSELELLTYTDYQNLEVRDDYICEGFMYPESITMFVSPPKQFKSITALTMGMSIAQGRDFLGLKVKKTPVLYLDLENNNLTIKTRQKLIFNGHNFETEEFPFYTLSTGLFMDAKKKIQEGFIMMLEKAIEKYEIGVLMIDTLHRVAYYDENKADDINLLYTKVLKPLLKKYSLSIMFLHHTTKEGEYRGSGDLLGMVDNYFKIKRRRKDNNYSIINENGRNGEIEDLQCEVIFNDDFIKINRTDKLTEDETFISKQKEITEVLKNIFSKFRKMKRKDLLDFLEEKGLGFNSKSVDRAVIFLCEQKYLSKERGMIELNESVFNNKKIISDKEIVLNFFKENSNKMFSLEEINSKIYILGKKDIKLNLKELKTEGIIFEPKEGYFKYLK